MSTATSSCFHLFPTKFKIPASHRGPPPRASLSRKRNDCFCHLCTVPFFSIWQCFLSQPSSTSQTWTQPRLNGKLKRCRKLASVSTVFAGSTTLVLLWSPVSSSRTNSQPRQMLFEQCTNVFSCAKLCQDPQTEFALLRESFGVSRINHILRVHGHTILQEQRATEIYDEVGQRSLERLFPGLTEDSMTQATLSAAQSGTGYKRERDIAAPAHLGALTAAKPRIQAMIQDAVTAGLLPKQPLVTRLATVIETATTTYLETLGDQATAKLYFQKKRRRQRACQQNS